MTKRTDTGSVVVSEANVFTMRELNQNTARVLEQINASGEQAAITKHGRFVALITPLADAEVEAVVLRASPVGDEVHRRATDGAKRLSSEDVLAQLDEQQNRH